VLTQWTRNPLCSISSMISGPHRRFNQCSVLRLALDLHRRSLLCLIGLTGDLIFIYPRQFNFSFPVRLPRAAAASPLAAILCRLTSCHRRAVLRHCPAPPPPHRPVPPPRHPAPPPPSIAVVIVLCVLCHHRGTLCSTSPRLLALLSLARSSRRDGSRQEEGKGARG
jgi:hypothetical protein